MENNNKYSVYTHKVVTDDNGPMWYVGITSTTHRWSPINYKETSLYPYIQKYGWDNIEHRVVYDGLDYQTAKRFEDLLILMYRSADCSVNKFRSGFVYSTDAKDYDRKYRMAERSKPEGKIYNRVTSFNQKHPDKMTETPMEAKRKYLETGYIPPYIKNDDL